MQGKSDEEIKLEIARTPIRCVPVVNETNDLKYSKIRSVLIENEKNVPSGKFGWCFMCRNSAGVYCKDTRVPVCNKNCKIKHLEECGKINNIFSLSDIFTYLFLFFLDKASQYLGVNKKLNHNPALNDALEIFKTLCKLSSKDQPK